MSVASVPVSSLATSTAPTSAPTQQSQSGPAVKKPDDQQQDNAPPVRASLPPKVGQVIDISA